MVEKRYTLCTTTNLQRSHKKIMSNPTKKCAKDMNKQYNRKQNANTNRTQINIDVSFCGFRELLFPMPLEIGLKIS